MTNLIHIRSQRAKSLWDSEFDKNLTSFNNKVEINQIPLSSDTYKLTILTRYLQITSVFKYFQCSQDTIPPLLGFHGLILQ